MSTIYLIRHGQAGLRNNYDELSGVGKAQARLLGEHLSCRGIRFDAIYSGALNRQRQTAGEVIQAYRRAGIALPGVIEDPHWSEFNLSAVYDELAPLLSAADPQFKREYDEMQRLACDENSHVQRTWLRCDMAVVRAWVDGTLECRSEPFAAFYQRVLEARETLSRFGSGETVAVFTSATPIGIWAAASLGAADGALLKLTGVLQNSAFATFRMRGDEVTLFSFNATPHLDKPELRTFR